MRRLCNIFASASFIIVALAWAQGTAYADGSASIIGLYPAAEVPIGAAVTFTVDTSGFTNPTYYVVDSFPGGVTTGNIDSSGNFSWTPNTDDVGTHGITITVSDSQGDSATASQQIVVDGAAAVSIGTLTPGTSVSIGTPVSFTASATGLLNPSYTVVDSFSNSSMHSYAITSSGVFNWTPISQDIGTHTITVTAKDIYGNTGTDSTQITVLPTPTVVALSLSPGTNVGVGQTFSFVATSTGFISPTYAVSDAFQGISTSTITIDASGKATWTPQYNDIGTHPLTLTASDSSGRSIAMTLSIKVSPQTQSTATQTVTPATSTAALPVTIPVTPAATPSPTPQATSPAQTNTAQPTSNTVPQNQPQTTPSVTPPATTNPTASTEEAPSNIAAEVTIPTTPPVESIGGFIFGSVINFFASIFKIF